MIVTISETWLGAKRFRIPGRFFRLLSTLNPVTVRLGRGMRYFDKLESVEAGAWSRVRAGDTEFDSVEITTSTSELCKFLITDGEAGYDRVYAVPAQGSAYGSVTYRNNIGVASSQIVVAGARRRLIFQADPTNIAPIWIAGVAAGTVDIRLDPGDVWIEDVIPQVDWFADSSSAGQILTIIPIT